MQQRAVVLGLAAMLALAGCSGSDLPSSGATTTTSPAPPVDTGSASPLDSGVASPATPSPTPAAASSATSGPTPVPAPACTTAELTAVVTMWQGAMGSQIASVTLTNASSATCTLRGTPGLQLVDAGGHVLIDSKSAGAAGLPHVSPGDEAFILAHGKSASTMVKVAEYCGSATPVMPTTVALLLPSGGGRLVAAPGPGGSVPPCNGSPGDPGSIQMNGWTR